MNSFRYYYTRILLLPVCLLVLIHVLTAQTDTIINRYRDYLLRTDTTSWTRVEHWSGTLQSDGRWPDIDYNDQTPAAWKVPDHLKRIQAMATAYKSPVSPLRAKSALLEKINLALDHWLRVRYQSSNWWHNEIGVPRYMRDIIILMQDQLGKKRLQDALEVLAQLRVHEDYVAGNLIWCADLGLHYGALTSDASLIRRCRNLIAREIKITGGEGIQPDYSFQQHGHRLQMFQYGKAYLWEGLRLAWELRGTALALPQDKVDLMCRVVLEGWQWMARGIYTVPGTMDRSSSRKGELKAGEMRPLIAFVKELQPQQAAAFDKMKTVQDGKSTLVGFRYYPWSDFAAYHRPGFSFFLKTISSRTLPTESINGENLKGKLLNSGDAYLIRNGREYTDLLPLWDWNRLPGITGFTGAHHMVRKDFNGAVSDGISGLSAMDYQITDSLEVQSLSARKFWACHKDQIICLIAGIQTRGMDGPVYTAMDQCRLQGRVQTNKEKRLQSGFQQRRDIDWIYHNGMAYIQLDTGAVDLQMQTVTGNWHAINRAESRAPLQEAVFMPVLHHDPNGANAGGYVLASVVSSREARRLARQPEWEILANNSQLQALRLQDGSYMAAFYEAGTLSWKGRPLLEVNQPCLVLLRDDLLFISDPTHRGLHVELRSGTLKGSAALPADGTTLQLRLQ